VVAPEASQTLLLGTSLKNKHHQKTQTAQASA
jgi:hypothetical protein